MLTRIIKKKIIIFLIILVNISLCHTIYYILSFYFLIIQLLMDDVPSKTCFVFIKKYRKNELQKHRVAHQGDILLLLRSLNNDNNDNNSNSYDNL